MVSAMSNAFPDASLGKSPHRFFSLVLDDIGIQKSRQTRSARFIGKNQRELGIEPFLGHPFIREWDRNGVEHADDETRALVIDARTDVLDDKPGHSLRIAIGKVKSHPTTHRMADQVDFRPAELVENAFEIRRIGRRGIRLVGMKGTTVPALIEDQNLVAVFEGLHDPPPIERKTHHSMQKDELGVALGARDLGVKLLEYRQLTPTSHVSRPLYSPAMEVMRKPHLHQDWIDSHAFGIVKALQKGGFTTYLVGGCVRDLLVGIHPKDFDIATAAVPQQVKRLIFMSFIIGKRFRLVLVKRNEQQFEVATFRREMRPEDATDPGQPTGDNIFGTPEEDARRRDFTINGLFYDPINEQLIDYVNGMPDIEGRVLRMIGDPEARLLEDPIRILRGLRLAHKLGFAIEPTLRSAMEKHASELARSVLPRRREEILKILRLDEPERTLFEAFDLGILKHVVPTLADLLSNPERRELFLGYFETLRSLVRDPSETTQLFGWLIFSMLKAAQDGPSERPEPISLEDELFQAMMRDELGMFKFEQTVVMKAVELLPNLKRADDFKRRGERRQLALMRNEGFRLAVRFAEADYELDGRQLTFWKSAYDRMADELQEIEADAKSKKRRRGRRRRPGERAGDDARGGSPGDVDSDQDDALDSDLPATDNP